MKKIKLVILTCIFMFVVTGCTIVRIDTSSIDNILSIILTKDNNLFNQVGQGYKYYVPGGVTFIGSDELNDILYSNGTYYYLYIDTINYYYKTDIAYSENKDAYYSRYLSPEISDKYKYYGYLEVNKLDDSYYVEFVYNYAKIEAQTTKEELNNVILNSSYILSTIKYNDGVINSLLNDENFINKAGKYNNYNIKDSGTKFELQKENSIEEE